MIQNDELGNILESHMKWINSEDDGIRADLSYIDLSHANLSNAYLRCVEGATIINADLSCANLIDTNLNGVIANKYTTSFYMQCPEKGSYIGYKKCRFSRIVELLIPEDAKRSSATSRKCRASKAKVLSITNIDGTANFEKAVSYYDCNFIYQVGEIVEVKDFDEDKWNECSNGIHHFITRNEAVNY